MYVCIERKRERLFIYILYLRNGTRERSQPSIVKIRLILELAHNTYINLFMYICMYVYIERKKERERLYIYIYIYIVPGG